MTTTTTTQNEITQAVQAANAHREDNNTFGLGDEKIALVALGRKPDWNSSSLDHKHLGKIFIDPSMTILEGRGLIGETGSVYIINYGDTYTDLMAWRAWLVFTSCVHLNLKVFRRCGDTANYYSTWYCTNAWQNFFHECDNIGREVFALETERKAVARSLNRPTAMPDILLQTITSKLSAFGLVERTPDEKVTDEIKP